MSVMDWKDMAGDHLISIHSENDGTFSVYEVPCAFCKATSGYRTLQQDSFPLGGNRNLDNYLLKCHNCANINFLTVEKSLNFENGQFESADFSAVRYPTGVVRQFEIHESWPGHISRYFNQAAKGIESESWDAVVIMCRSTLQAVVREKNATGANLKQEIDDLGDKNLIVQSMVDWSHKIREIANEAAHPKPNDPAPTEAEAREIVKFTHFMLEILYTIPATAPR